MSGREHAHGARCQNCGAPLSGPYCSACGQRDIDYTRSFGHILEDALEGFLHFDGKFALSARYIFTRPGFLTREFIAGRRVRYTHPVRFYVFASFLFFAVTALTSRPVPPGPVGPPAGSAAKGLHAAVSTVYSSRDGGGERGWLGSMIRVDASDGDAREIAREFVHLLPEMLFVCIPLLALVLKLVYLRARLPYIEHLVFALHVQAFVFLFTLVNMLASGLGGLAGPGAENAVGTVLFVVMAGLVYRAVRVVYGQGRWVTLLKLALVGAVYGAVVVLGLAGVLYASLKLVPAAPS